MSYVIHKRVSALTARRDGGNLLRARSALYQFLLAAHCTATPDSILLFGYPGAGKSSLIDAALKDLDDSRDGHMDIVEVNCTNLIARYPDATSALTELVSMRRRYLSSVPDFRVFVLDETDAIGPRRDRVSNSAQASLCYFCMDSLGIPSPGVVWLLVTNYPHLLDPAITSRVGKRLYLPCPDREAARVIIEGRLQAGDAQLVVDALLVPTAEYVITSRGLVEGMKFLVARGLVSADRLGCAPDVAAQHVRAAAAFPQKFEVDEYFNQHRFSIEQSELLMRAYGV